MSERFDISKSEVSEPQVVPELEVAFASAPARRKRWPFVLLALGLLLVASAAALWLWQATPNSGMEPNVIVGPMGDYTGEELEAMLRDKVDAGMIAFSINAQVVLEGPDAQAPLLFENPGNNAKLLKLTLVRDDTGALLYESGFLAPGSYVGKDTLDVHLDPGTYVCTATIAAYREDTRAPLGQAAAQVVVTVLDDAANEGR